MTIPKSSVLLFLGIFFTVSAFSQGKYQEPERILNIERNEFDRFGFGVSIQDSMVMVGSPKDDIIIGLDTFANCGSVAYFKHSDTGWVFINRFTKPIPSALSSFGTSVLIHGNYTIISEANNMFYIYYLEDGVWNFHQEFVIPAANYVNESPRFSAYGRNLIVNAPYSEQEVNGEIENTGAVFHYQINLIGDWEYKNEITAPVKKDDDYFGFSTSINKGDLYVGAWGEDENQSEQDSVARAGAVYHYHWNGIEWGFVSKIVSPTRQEEELFGFSVKATEDHLFVTSFRDDFNEVGGEFINNAGAVYVFERDSDSSVLFSQKLVALNRASSAEYGRSIDALNNKLVIGYVGDSFDSLGQNEVLYAGSAEVYLFNESMQKWEFNQKLLASQREEEFHFGYMVNLTEKAVIIGAPFEGEDNSEFDSIYIAGGAYIFEEECFGVYKTLVKDTACGYYVFPGTTDSVFKSGIYTYNHVGKEGCDSVIEYSIHLFKKVPAKYTFMLKDYTIDLVADTNFIDSFIWDFGDRSNKKYGPTITHTYTQYGVYFVQLCVYHRYCGEVCTGRLIDLNGNSDSGAVNSINDIVVETQILIYPNPANNVLTIKSEHMFSSISIFDLKGRKQELKVPDYSVYEIELSIENLLQGFYIMQLFTSEGPINFKIKKE
ncbi:MAG: hypothetical protein ACJA2N_002032 [Salibacteraceae bacterium]|jgi:hypothetical protein